MLTVLCEIWHSMMDWIHRFQFFLFDFDGLLVNTEYLHYQAYVNMLAQHGFRLSWNFAQFCELAHLNATALKENLYAEFSDLDPNWEVLYAEKMKAYFELLIAGKVELMPGVAALLSALDVASIRRCVVTNSLLDQTKLIRSQIPILRTIDHWITREDYEKPKPYPDGYLRAIELYSKAGDRIIGFEDTLRGLQALRQTPATPVLICPGHHPLLEIALEGGGGHFESIAEIPTDAFLHADL